MRQAGDKEPVRPLEAAQVSCDKAGARVLVGGMVRKVTDGMFWICSNRT